jgi:hypothetical protein
MVKKAAAVDSTSIHTGLSSLAANIGRNEVINSSSIHTGLSSLAANIGRNEAINSSVSTFNASKIELREVSSLKT